MSAVKWSAKVDHLMACNCEFGCPCSFNAPPTHGKCEAANATQILEGESGGVDLKGLAWVAALAWPGAIHERGGRGVVWLDERAAGDKREALEAIATGKAGGPIGTLMGTVDAGLDVRTAAIEFKSAGGGSLFRAGTEVTVEFAPLTNPVTGAEHRAILQLPGGLLTQEEEFFASKRFDVKAGAVAFSYPGRNTLHFRTTWKGP